MTLLHPQGLHQQLDITQNPFHQKNWVPQFKFFKFHAIQIWTRFTFHGRNPIFLAPKILKFGQTLSYEPTHHHKYSQNFLRCLELSGISSNTLCALFIAVKMFSKFRNRQKFREGGEIDAVHCTPPHPLLAHTSYPH